MINVHRDSNKIIDAIKNSTSQAHALRNLGIVPAGANFKSIKRWVHILNIDVSHWGGKRKKKEKFKPTQKPIELYLKPDILISNFSGLKRKLIKSGLLEQKCDECGVGNSWNNKPLVLQLDHKDGLRHNNQLENLRLLCPNCHSQTDTFTSKNRIKNPGNKVFYGHGVTWETNIPEKLVPCKICNNPCPQQNTIYCSHECWHKDSYKIKWPTKEELDKLVWTKPISGLAKELGVSDRAISKRCKVLGINTPPVGYWNKIYAQKQKQSCLTLN